MTGHPPIADPGSAVPAPATAPTGTPGNIDDFLSKYGPGKAGTAPANIDDFMAHYAPPELSLPQSYGLAEGGGLMNGDHWDSLFTGNTPGARILSAMGAGANEAWGAAPISWGDDTVDFLKREGLFNEALRANADPRLKGFNEAFLRPAAWLLGTTAEIAYRDLGAIQQGAAAGVYQTGQELEAVPGVRALAPGKLAADIAGSIQTGGPFIGSPGLFGEITRGVATPRYAVAPEEAAANAAAANEAAISALNPERLRSGNLAVEPPARGQVTIESITAPPLGAPFRPGTIPEARALGVIGEGENGYFDLGTPTPEQQTARDAANAAIPTERPAAPATQPDIDTAARRLEPGLFAQYDPLAREHDALRRQLGDWRQGMLDDFDREIEQLRGQRLETASDADRRDMANRISALENDRQAFADYEGDLPAVAETRQRFLDVDRQMRDLAPQVSDAYRRAAAGTPAEAVAPIGETLPAPAEQAVPLATGTAETPAAQPATSAENAPVAPIAQDVARQLVAAGRPQEEADAAGALIAAHYEARADRFAGAKGTAQDLYAAEAPTVTGPRQLAFAQGQALDQTAKGRITINDAQTAIKLLKNADASTFIHETGHAWLEELMRDAADPQAPDQLRADAAAVHGWLGTTEGETIPTKAHEKWARGFERYMMEGRAPSSALADVFAKFKTWLTGIYQTVDRLRAPINDNICGVFDRLLATPDRGAVIAPEHEAVPDFATRHEALADNTAPEHAATVADHIREEADRVAAEKAPEIHAELSGQREPAAGPGPERGVGEREAEAQQPDRNAAAPEPSAGSTGAAGSTGTVEPGRGEAAPESAAIRANEPGTDNPVTAAIPAGDTRLIDKAGNIRLDNINSPEEWKEALRQGAERNDNFLERRRGVVTDAQRNELANLLGTTPERVFTKAIGDAFSDSEIKFLEKSLAQSTERVVELVGKAVASGNEADEAAATSALLRHDMIQGLYSQAEAESGRAQRALRKSQEFWTAASTGQSEGIRRAMEDATGRSPEQMRDLFQKILTFNQKGPLNKFIRDSMKPGLFDWLQAVWTNGILSNPFTHMTYSAAGEIYALYREFWQTPFQATVGTIRGALTGDARHASFRMMAPEAYGHLMGAAHGMRAAWSAIKENRQILPPEVEALRRGAGQMVQQAGGVIPNPTVMIRGRNVPIPIGTTLEAPMRMVSALHSFNWQTFYEQGKGGIIFRTAQDEGLQPGTDAFARRIADLSLNPTQAIIEEASTYADAGALVTRAPYNSVMGRLSRVLHHGHYFEPLRIPIINKELPLGTFRPGMYVDPFIQIQGNILRAAYLNGTPMEAFTGAARDDLMGRNGGLAFDLRAGKILAGTSFALMAGALAYGGLLNDSGPSEPTKAYWWRKTHGMPHGLHIGNLVFNVLRMGPLGMQMSVAADLTKVAGDASTGDMSQAAADLVHAISENFLDESFAEGPQRMLQAINDSDRYGAAWIRQFAASLVPYSGLLRGVTHEIDPYTRRARTTADAIKAITPGVSQELNPNYDYWGQPVPNQGWALTYYQHLAPDPVDDKLEQLGVAPGMPKQWLRGIQLTDDQYALYGREGGRLARQQVEAIMRVPGFDRFPPGIQIDMIDKAVGAGHRLAATRLLQHDLAVNGPSSIIEEAIERKAAHIETGAPIRQPAH